MVLFAQNLFCLFSHWIESIVKMNGTYWKLNITLGCDYFPKTNLTYHQNSSALS